MAKFRKKPVVIEAITFDELVELVEYERSHGGKYRKWNAVAF